MKLLLSWLVSKLCVSNVFSFLYKPTAKISSFSSWLWTNWSWVLKSDSNFRFVKSHLRKAQGSTRNICIHCIYWKSIYALRLNFHLFYSSPSNKLAVRTKIFTWDLFMRFARERGPTNFLNYNLSIFGVPILGYFETILNLSLRLYSL